MVCPHHGCAEREAGLRGGERGVPDAGRGFHEVDRGETEFFEGELGEFEELLVVEEGVHHDEERVL